MTSFSGVLRVGGTLTESIATINRRAMGSGSLKIDSNGNAVISSGYDRYCRDEMIYYTGQHIIRFMRRNPNAFLIAKGANPQFEIDVPEKAVKAVMGPWVDSLNPLASPYFIRLIIGEARYNRPGFHQVVMQKLRQYQQAGKEWTPSMREAWVPDAKWELMGGFGLSNLASPVKPVLINIQSRLAYPKNRGKAFPPMRLSVL